MSTIDKLIRRQIKLTILSVIAVVLITSTITYALYQTNHENTTDQTITIGNLGLTQTGTPITLEGLYPMEEFDLTSSYPRYEFTLENKTNGVNNDYTLMYELILRTDENTTLSQDDYQYIMYKIDGNDARALSEVWDSEINGFKILDGRLLSHKETTLSTDLANKDIENHSIVFWLSTYAPNSVQGKVLTLKMSLEAYADRFNYLKYYVFDSNDMYANVFGKTSVTRDQFESITALDKIDIPEYAIEFWDVSNKQNKSIMAWYTDNDNNGLYELYIGQNGGVVANPNCRNLFKMYKNVITIDVSHLKTSLVTTMQGMFGGRWTSRDAYFMSVTSILGLENFDTSSVTSMSGMFFCCNKLNNFNIENFKTSNVTTMEQMFTNNYSIISLNLSNFNTSNVTNMRQMFDACFSLKKLDLSSFSSSNLINVDSMLRNTIGLEELDISNMLFNKVTVYVEIFRDIKSRAKIIINECAEEFVRARLIEANRNNVTLEVVPCVKVCYSNNINNLPSEYTELSYIESTGTQYIDSEYKPALSTGIYADFQFNDLTTTTYPKLFGTLVQTYNPLYYTFYISSNKWAYSNLNTSLINSNIAADLKKHVLEYNIQNKKVLLDSGVTLNSTLTGTQTQSSISNLTIMAGSASDTIDRFSKLKLYSFKIYENRTLVRNYIPAIRKSGNVVGLYETEEGKFYENSGTGVFNSDEQTLIGTTIELAHTIDARPGYTFVGWNTKPDGSGTTFKQGEEVDISVLKSLGDGTITLYAMWEAN